MTVRSKPTWSDVKAKLEGFDRPGLIGLVQDLYATSKTDRRSLTSWTQATRHRRWWPSTACSPRWWRPSSGDIRPLFRQCGLWSCESGFRRSMPSTFNTYFS